MDLGLGNLIELKRQLLPAAMLAQTTYDVLIAALGKGLAAQFEKHCNRKFARVASETDEIAADRASWIVSRYPLESISAFEMRSDLSTGWVSLGDVNSTIINWDADSGLIEFGTVQGIYLQQLRITYTGGYWYDTAETENTSQPAGSTIVPGDLKLAWYLHARLAWQTIDKLGTNLLAAGLATGANPPPALTLPGLDASPEVIGILRRFMRYSLT